MNTIGQTNAVNMRGGVGKDGYLYTGATAAHIKYRLIMAQNFNKGSKDLVSYMHNGELIIPSQPKDGVLPQGAKALPVNNGALKNIVDHFVLKYPKHASKELGFVTGGFSPPGYVQVTARNSGLGIYYNEETGKPMGK